MSVVLPFLGDAGEGRRVVERLAALRTGSGDELIVADNTPAGVVEAVPESGVNVVRAPQPRSASHARNRGAATASGEWLLFLDADCLLPPDLLDAYFDPQPAEKCAVVAGEIVGDPDQDGALPRWSRSRRGRWVEQLLARGLRPAAVSANMLVRRSAFAAAGGFQLGGGGDFDLSWRLLDAGWELELRPHALVRHRDRETLREVGEQARGYGSHLRSLSRRHGASVDRPKLVGPLGRAGAGAVVWLARREPERARQALFDGYYAANAWAGALGGSPRRRRAD